MTKPVTLDPHPVGMDPFPFRSLRYATVFQHGNGWYLAIKTVENGTGFNRGMNAVSLTTGHAWEFDLDETVLVPQQAILAIK